MRPLRLSMTAFGPYGGTETVDFGPLAELGLFVVAGPNGAGKTTIFDGLYYCLYGRLPGRRHDYPHLRSDHADPESECSVTLDFAANNQHWRVTRSPRQVRAKRNGSGTTEITASATLWQLDQSDTPIGVANRINEVNERCLELIGLTGPQFERVALLPQGEFSRFLRESSTQRREVLRALFGTGVFDRATNDLRALADGERSAHHHALEHLHLQLNLVLDRVAGLDGQSVPQLDGAAPGPSAILDDLQNRIDALRANGLHQLQQAVTRRQAVANSAAETHRTAERHHQALVRRSELHTTLAALDSSSATVENHRERIARAHDAVPVVAAYQTMVQAKNDLASAQADRDRLDQQIRSQLLAAGISDVGTSSVGTSSVDQQSSGQAESPAPDLIQTLVADRHRELTAHIALVTSRERIQASIAQAEQDRRSCVATLTEIQDQQRQSKVGRAEAQRTIDEVANRPSFAQIEHHVAVTTELLSNRQIADRQSVEATRIRDEIDGLQTTIANAETALAAALDAQQKQASLEAQAQSLSGYADQLKSAGDVLRDIEDLSKHVAGHQQELRQAEDVSRDVFARFVAGTAGRLASSLETDQPCPVCGSCSHPKPASTQSSDGLLPPDIATVEAARAAEQALRSTSHASSERLDQLIATSRQQLIAITELDGVAGALSDPAISRYDAITLALAQATDSARQARIDADESRQNADAGVEHQSEIARATSQIEAARRRLGEATSAQDRALGSLGASASLTVDELERQVAQARSDLQRAAADTHRSDRAHVSLEEHRRQGTTLVAAASVAENRLADIEKVLSGLHQEQAAAIAEIDSSSIGQSLGDRDHQTLTSELEQLEQVKEILPRYATTIGANETRLQVLERAQSRLDTNLNMSPFVDIATAQASFLPSSELDKLEHEVAAHQAERQRLVGQLDELPSVPTVVPDLATTRTTSDLEQAALEQSRNELSEFAAELHQIEQSVASIEHQLSPLLLADQESVRMQRVAQLVAGDNDHNVSLENWVLASHLRDVVELANLRLARSTGERFQLCVADKGKNRRGRWGIDLEIEDTVTGTRRPTEGLSGGELFQASLALALGLADVVMRLNGGVRIDALFVDEGFGSLDETSVERAVDLLDAVRGQGSLVGVITHVPTLLDSLPRGITVSPRADGEGSTVRQNYHAA